MLDTLKAIIPPKHSQKMHTVELMIGAVIAALPALTESMTVAQAGYVMLGATLLRIYLVSIKQS